MLLTRVGVILSASKVEDLKAAARSLLLVSPRLDLCLKRYIYIYTANSVYF